MAPDSSQQLSLSLDTNVLIDLAAGEDFAGTILDFLIHEQNASVKIPPAVVEELDFISERPDLGKRKAELAGIALNCLLSWGITPTTLAPVQFGIAEKFSRLLIRSQLIPEAEFHDGCILAEVALSGSTFLITSDHHLVDIDRVRLKKHFHEMHLPVIEIVSPRRLYFRLMDL